MLLSPLEHEPCVKGTIEVGGLLVRNKFSAFYNIKLAPLFCAKNRGGGGEGGQTLGVRSERQCEHYCCGGEG